MLQLQHIGNALQRCFKKVPTFCRIESCYRWKAKGEALNATIDIASVFERHVKTVYRLCYSYFGNAADAEDATQATFMKLVVSPRSFNGEEHEKAWLLKCAANVCKDELKSARRTRSAEMPPDVVDDGASAETSDVLQAVLALPEQYKDCVYLHYYEGYKTVEIAAMTDTPSSTIRNRLSEARNLLRTALGKSA